ncbi:MAG: alanine/ornithine racemase family PLP-dependent enzyme [Thermodesulfobacteriota bacterium]|nr:alanine/ornithine racemase family PLP-dependent enzyme [Thermodesulfobacteriota bacterium]
MTTPYITIDLDKIEHNARTIVELCKVHGIEVTGVTKVICGHPGVAAAMLRGGVVSIADSRLENIQRLKDGGVDSSYMLLRLPPLSGVDEVVESVDVSLNSELSILAALSQAAGRRGLIHDVILMVDLGDLREGIWPDDLISFVREALQLPGIRIRGLGVNLACFSGVAPSEDNMNLLVELADTIGKNFDLTLDWISGANSSGLELIRTGRMPQRINHARIGEAILLGRETIHRRPWPGTWQDTFILHAEVLELKTKPSMVVGKRGEDAFGRQPIFEDRGKMKRALLNVGREDIDIKGITPLDSRLKILGASSGYLAMDVTNAPGGLQVGDELAFSLNYSALLAAMTSQYVKKRSLQNGIYLDERL